MLNDTARLLVKNFSVWVLLSSNFPWSRAGSRGRWKYLQARTGMRGGYALGSM